MFSSLFYVFSAFLLALFHLVNAAPVEFLAFRPTITQPTAETIWTCSTNQTITWETNNVPSEAQNYTLVFLLGRLTSDSENLDLQNPLASQVPIMQGTVNITVPSQVNCSNDCIVCGIGDSGDITPKFTILPS